MDKRALLALLVRRLEDELAAIRAAALATHAEATSEENKAENKYDTRGLEASYLAHGQSKAAEEAAQALAQFQGLSPRSFAAGEPAELGALLTVEGRNRQKYFLGPRAGGTEVTLDGESVMVVTPSSPLGRQLVGKTAGASVPLDLAGSRSVHRIVSVE
ncbi:MAG TPA: transcription elongation factor [Candidatus Didemnitutus sp.]|nr:transcription elongation factor [Candidatus Didemnitutus sp.]